MTKQWGRRMAQPADVFISYSSKDVEHAEALEALLEKAGLTVWRDKKRLVPGGNYVFSIHDGIENAKRVAVLWSRNSIASDYVTAEAEYARGKKKLVPVDIEPCEPKVPFNIDHRLPLSIVNTAPEILLRALSGEKQRDGTYRIHSIAPADIDTSRLPQTFSPELFGRDTEMAQLFDAWDSGHTPHRGPRRHRRRRQNRARALFSPNAGGRRLARRAARVRLVVLQPGHRREPPGRRRPVLYRGADLLRLRARGRRSRGAQPRGPHAHAQGDRRRAARADPHRTALTRRERAARSPASSATHRTLLFLDGMEPLQYPAGRTGGGKDDSAGISGMLKDKGMALLLRELAADNPGLVIVTTRIKLKDLKEFHAPAVLPIALTALTEAPAVELLKARGVTGSEKHLAKLANDLRGHALALNLVAQYLVTHHGGDARRADLLPDLVHVGGDDERDPYRVMYAYEIELKKQIALQLGIIPEWAHRVKLDRLFKAETHTLSENALSTPAGRQLALLYMLGLFDQPVPREVFDALIAPPAIPGLTDGIAGRRCARHAMERGDCTAARSGADLARGRGRARRTRLPPAGARVFRPASRADRPHRVQGRPFAALRPLSLCGLARRFPRASRLWASRCGCSLS